MARSKRRTASASSPRKIPWGGGARPGDRRANRMLAAAVIVVLLGGLGFWWWQSSRDADLRALAAEGQAGLAAVETLPGRGRDHLEPGQPFAYGEPFPTSGPHDPAWTPPGVYETPQPPTRLVHALEHGNIVIYYDEPAASVLDRLRQWAGLYDGQWDGVVVVPADQLGQAVVLTAWTHRLRLDPFEPATAAAFIDAYRGRGPEHPVR